MRMLMESRAPLTVNNSPSSRLASAGWYSCSQKVIDSNSNVAARVVKMSLQKSSASTVCNGHCDTNLNLSSCV